MPASTRRTGFQQGAGTERFPMPRPATDPLRSKQAELAAATRHHPERVDELRRDYAAAKLEDFVRRTVDAAPPLTDEQRARVARLLRGGGA